jgi:hypothetical protein
VTYRLDSDVPWLYGGFMELKTGKLIDPLENYKWLEPDEQFHDEYLFNLTKRKSKEVAWFLTNCNSPSKRNEMTKELQKYISVDIFGPCGPFK